MNSENLSLVEKYVPHNYVQQGNEARQILEKKVRILLEQGKIPQQGWDDLSIEHFLHEISLMDSNNFPENCGVGEREARIYSPLVAKRHYYLGHGIGRSGDIAEVQPKAAGSSLIAKLTQSLALDVIKMAGASSAVSCLVLPVATGMAMVLTLLTLSRMKPNAKYVIWSRIDQKSCFKSILTAGLVPIVIEGRLVGEQLCSDVQKIEESIASVGAENVVCVMTTTSCFAPRAPDDIEEIASLCKASDVAHVVNNAYGLQSTKCMHLIHHAARTGRVDAFVQSTDKNFLVPVGGAIVAAFDKSFVAAIGKTYPGRASASPVLDLFITLLSLGKDGYKKLLNERKEMYRYLSEGLDKVARCYGERLLTTRRNPISLAVSLDTISQESASPRGITEFGSYLFKRSVSGTRVVTPHESKVIGGFSFSGWGSHSSHYPGSYMTAAAAIGMTTKDVDLFLRRLDKTFKAFHHHRSPPLRPLGSRSEDTSDVVCNGSAGRHGIHDHDTVPLLLRQEVPQLLRQEDCTGGLKPSVEGQDRDSLLLIEMQNVRLENGLAVKTLDG